MGSPNPHGYVNRLLREWLGLPADHPTALWDEESFQDALVTDTIDQKELDRWFTEVSTQSSREAVIAHLLVCCYLFDPELKEPFETERFASFALTAQALSGEANSREAAAAVEEFFPGLDLDEVSFLLHKSLNLLLMLSERERLKLSVKRVAINEARNLALLLHGVDATGKATVEANALADYFSVRAAQMRRAASLHPAAATRLLADIRNDFKTWMPAQFDRLEKHTRPIRRVNPGTHDKRVELGARAFALKHLRGISNGQAGLILLGSGLRYAEADSRVSSALEAFDKFRCSWSLDSTPSFFTEETLRMFSQVIYRQFNIEPAVHP